MTYFNCDSCNFSKEVSPDLVGRRAKCPSCGVTGTILDEVMASLDESATGTEPLVAETHNDPTQESGISDFRSHLRARKNWHSRPLIVSLAIAVVAIATVGTLFGSSYMLSKFGAPGRVSGYPTNIFDETIDLGGNRKFVAKYPFRRLYIPANSNHGSREIPQNNRSVDFQLFDGSERVEVVADLFNVDGKPESLTCRTSDANVATASVVNGDAIVLDLMGPGKVTLFAKFMNKEMEIEFELVEVPIKIGVLRKEQTTQNLIQNMGFPDTKQNVFPARDRYEMINGFSHEKGTSYEHWRYERFEGLFVVVEKYSDVVVGLGNEHPQ